MPDNRYRPPALGGDISKLAELTPEDYDYLRKIFKAREQEELAAVRVDAERRVNNPLTPQFLKIFNNSAFPGYNTATRLDALGAKIETELHSLLTGFDKYPASIVPAAVMEEEARATERFENKHPHVTRVAKTLGDAAKGGMYARLGPAAPTAVAADGALEGAQRAAPGRRAEGASRGALAGYLLDMGVDRVADALRLGPIPKSAISVATKDFLENHGMWPVSDKPLPTNPALDNSYRPEFSLTEAADARARRAEQIARSAEQMRRNQASTHAKDGAVVRVMPAPPPRQILPRFFFM